MRSGIVWTTLLLLVALGPLPAMESKTSDSHEIVQTGRDIWVQAGDNVSEATCFGCSIHVRGSVSGDASALGGRVVVEHGGTIGGDVAAIAGDVVVENGASVGGDVAAIGGAVRRLPQAVIGGDTDSVGAGWLIPIALIPLLVLGGLISLIVWLLHRPRRTAAVPGTA